jgi:hypothetical protein
MKNLEPIAALAVERPCYPATTHRYRRVGKSEILCCVRCGQGKRDIVGVAALDEERLARALHTRFGCNVECRALPEGHQPAWTFAVDAAAILRTIEGDTP